LKVTLERLPESRMQLDIEVDQERVDRQFEAAFKRLASRARVPGFRPGKAPRPMVEKALGRDRIMGEALDKLVPDVYNEALESEDIPAIAQPTLENVEMDPVRFKFTVPVRPTVEFVDHRAIRVEQNPVEVSDELVAEQLLGLRRRNAIHAPVERPATWNDILTLDIKGIVDDVPFIQDEDAEIVLREGQPLFVKGLAEAIHGMTSGEEKTVEITMPDDFRVERLRGKPAAFELKVKEIKEEQLPAEDDELAQMVNAEEFETFEDLRTRIHDDLLKNLQAEEDNRRRSAAIDALVGAATFDYPAVLVDREIDHLLKDMMGNDEKQYAAYLARIGRNAGEYRETFREVADIRLKRSLALSKLTEAEQIDVSPDEVEAEIDRLAEPMGEETERFKELFNTPEGIITIRRNLISERTLQRLLAIASGEAPELPPAPAAEAPEPTQSETPEEASA
jgi:trigger factor